MNTLDHLIYMANQIARNCATLDEDAAAQATAAHILDFWDPRMKSRIIEYAAQDGSKLLPVTAKAIAQLAKRRAVNV